MHPMQLTSCIMSRLRTANFWKGTRNFLFAWPSAKSAVMGPAQLAGVISIVSRAAAEARFRAMSEGGVAALEGSFQRDALWRHGISGDAPITTQSTFAQADIGAHRRFVP